MPPITLASQQKLASDSDMAAEAKERCCIIHDLLPDANWAAVHSQIQSETAPGMIAAGVGDRHRDLKSRSLGWEAVWWA